MNLSQPLPSSIPSLSSNDLDRVLEDSKKTIEAQQTEKKGRGRPKKDGTTSLSGVASKPITAKPDPLAYKTMLAGLIRFSGEFLATGTKFEGFKMTDQEVDLLSTQGSDVAAEFMPVIDSKYAKLGMFTMSAVSIYGIKYYTFMEVERIKILNQNKLKNVNEQPSP